MQIIVVNELHLMDSPMKRPRTFSFLCWVPNPPRHLDDLQQEKRKQRCEIEELRREKGLLESQNALIKKEMQALRTQLEETEWAMCQKNGEISLLKCQLKEFQGDQTTKGHEMIALRTQLRDAQTFAEKKQKEIRTLQDQAAAPSATQQFWALNYDPDLACKRTRSNCMTMLNQPRRCKYCGNPGNPSVAASSVPPPPRPHHGASKTLIVAEPTNSTPGRFSVHMAPQPPTKISTLERDNKAKMERDIAEVRRELHEERENFEAERANWLEEKEKVIKYQKQLQMNYVQMFRRTRALEEELSREKSPPNNQQQLQQQQQQQQAEQQQQQQQTSNGLLQVTQASRQRRSSGAAPSPAPRS
ncbi:unnamed protein product, partial [Notodromas monacha]